MPSEKGRATSGVACVGRRRGERCQAGKGGVGASRGRPGAAPSGAGRAAPACRREAAALTLPSAPESGSGVMCEKERERKEKNFFFITSGKGE